MSCTTVINIDVCFRIQVSKILIYQGNRECRGRQGLLSLLSLLKKTKHITANLLRKKCYKKEK